MSTKKRLLEVVNQIADINKAERTAFSQINAYEIAQDIPKLTRELSMIYEELERKKKTSITDALFLRNGFEHEEVSSSHFGLTIHFYNFGAFEVYRHGNAIFLADTNIELRTVAELENALDLCGIDKDIEI